MKIGGILKKGLAVSLCALMLGGAAAVVPEVVTKSRITASAAQPYGDFDCVIGNNEVGIKLYMGDDENVTIPSVINGKKVTSIFWYAFQCCQNLKSITIPNSVTSIGGYSFEGCRNLTSITIPDSVTSIGLGAFVNTAWYNKQPDGMVYAGKVAYCYKGTMPKNTSLTFKSGTKGIAGSAFTNCTNLTSVTIPNSVTCIGEDAFSDCRNLTSVTIPDSITSISSTSFINTAWYDKKPDGLVYAGKFVYSYKGTMPKNTSLTIKSGTKGIADKAFYGCRNLTSITIPDSVTSIGFMAFEYACTDNTEGLTIHGTKGSAAEKYAKDNGFKFVVSSNTVAPTSVSLNKTSMTLGKGETTKLTATVAPSNATNKSVKWRTSDSKVLTVDKNGNVKAVGNGTAWITARTVNGKEKSCKITVKNAPNKVTISKGVVTIGVGEKFTVGSAVPDGSAAAKRTYRTSNSSIVKMTRTDWQGDFVGVKPGTAYVTVRTYNGKESTCKVTVKAAPKSVTISKKALTMKVGQTATLSCSVPSNAGCAARTFRTSNSSVVKMTKTSWTGTFKAMKKGTAYVTVRTYNGKEASCKITVK